MVVLWLETTNNNNKKQQVSMKLKARAEVGAGVVAKTDQKKSTLIGCDIIVN